MGDFEVYDPARHEHLARPDERARGRYDDIDDLIRQGREGSKWMFWEDSNGRRHASEASVDTLLAELADALESLRPRTITTVEELDALPYGSIVLDGNDDAELKVDTDQRWLGLYSGGTFEDSVTLPATVLYTPTEGDKT